MDDKDMALAVPAPGLRPSGAEPAAQSQAEPLVPSAWRPISEAPQDGAVILTYWQDQPVFVAWVRMADSVRVTTEGAWPFRKRVEERLPNSGWRVLMTGRDGGWGVHGNYAPFTPEFWMHVPGRWDELASCDRSGEAGETGTGSTEGESAVGSEADETPNLGGSNA